MLKRNNLKILTFSFFFMGAVLFISPALYPESFFLKNGSIIEGRITGEDDSKITLESADGKEKKILRKEIKRVLVHDRYKYKQYITKSDGTKVEGYIVDEDNKSYTLRAELGSADEVKISRDKVETLSTKKVPERFTAPSAYSSVFIKDGGIIDCRIIRETADSIGVTTVNGEKKNIFKKDILRIQYNNSYKDKKILNKTDGTKVEAYIMNEDYDSYIYRTELYSPAEVKIYKNELNSISRK